MNAGASQRRVRRRSLRVVVAVLIGLALVLVTAQEAFAGVGFGVTPTFPSTVTVGQTGLPASVQILNASTPPESAGNVTINAINLVPACGTTTFVGAGDCPAAQADPGVFALSPTGTGEAGTACAGQTFTIAIIDPATGQVSFTPSGGPVVLTPPATPNSVCRIDFTFSVLKAPTKPAGVSPPNTIQTAQIGFAAGTAAVNGATGTGSGSSFVTVAKAAPSITTTATTTAKVGTPTTDTAHLAPATPPGPAPTGTITFTLFGPQPASPATCTGAAVFTSTVTVSSGTGDYTSAPFTPTAPGTYRWVAAYSGDANNAPATTACGDAGETTTVTQATPTLVTTASAPVTIGTPISDSAVLAGGFNPTGTIVFTAFGPNNSTCTGVPAFTSAPVTVAGNGTYASGPFTPTTAGTYRFVATYSGDANNAALATGCNDAGESVVVAPASPTIVTTASAPVRVGGTISDSAVLAGGVAPTGSIVFTVFGPNNLNCTGAAAFTSTATVNGNGTYSSGSFTTTAAGTYRFVAAYSGDVNNNAVTSLCNAANEAVVVAPATPTIATTASAPVTVGSPISDTATLAGGFNPTGTITFTLFGPNNSTCTGAAIFTSVVPVNAGNGAYPSGPFTPTAPGTYRFVAAYSGDANNAGATSACNDAAEAVVVSPAAPRIVTTASAPVTVGNPISDTATLSNGVNPTGTITFTLFGPNNSTCTGAAIFTSVVPVNAGNGTYPSGAFTPATAGTYRFIATYSGDANNTGTATACNDAGESVVVSPATPTIVTHATPSVAAGSPITDTATLAGGTAPTGTITFTLFGPNNATCTGAAIFTSTVPVNTGNGNYTSAAFTANAAGTYRWIAAYSGDTNNVAVTTACNDANEASVVIRVTPTIVTTASPSVPIGGAITDTATLAGGTNPTGTITFTAFGPNNATCTGLAAFTSTVPVAGNGTYPAGPFVPTAAGSYRWIAAYSGDVANAAATTACNDANETNTVTPTTPAIVTSATPTATLGAGAIADTATLSGGTNPTGTITFTLFGPNNAACTGAPIATSTRTVIGNGTYPSDPFTPTAAGTYRWIAAYSGDTNNNAVTTACNDANEVSVVAPAKPAIVTNASASVPVGGAISDTATLSGGTNPTGTITFTLFGPNNAACTGAPIATSTRTVAGNGNYTSDPFTTTAAGTYRWIASYGGDANNAATATACNDANESVVVTPAPPTIVTTASGPVPVGGSISDSATLAGGVAPTGTIVFTAFGPGNPTCTGVAAFTFTVPVNHGNGVYSSGPSAPVASAGSYNFVAVYSGDANNSPATSPCGAAGETANVSPTPLTITTAASVAASGRISDTATLHGAPVGAAPPTGTVTFKVFGPADATCAGPVVFTSTNPVTGGTTAVSDAFQPSTASGGPGTYRFIATYNGDANYPAVSSLCNDAGESVAIPTPVIHVTKAAAPPSEVEPGGTFTFTVQVSNPSAVDPITITTLTDNIYGNLATRPGSTCGTLIGVTLAPGATSAPCSFTGPFTGKAGDSQTDTVTVNGVDVNGFTATDTAQATVTLTPQPPQISVTKAAAPPTQPEPTGTFTFTVQVHNPSTLEPVTITQLVDNVYGNLATRAGSTCGALIGTTLPPGGTSPTCTFTGPFTGKAGDTQTDTVTVTGVNNGITVTATAMATVGLTPAPPQIAVTKAAAPPSQVEPGGTFTFTVQVSNPSTLEPVTITQLVDNVYGDLAARPGSTCATLIGVKLAPGAVSPTCTFTGPFIGKAGDSQTDTVTVTGVNNGTTVTATAMATVTLTPQPPQISVTKAAAPPTQVEPTGTFTFTVQVHNPSTLQPVTITQLVDNVYGNLATRPGSTCGALISTTLPPGGTSPTCTFTGTFTGKAGDTQTDTVTVTGVNNGITVTATAMATVGLTPQPPQIAVTKAAAPPTEVEPGGTFTFTVVVSNPSTLEPVRITQLVDNIYGDLSTRAGSTCGNLIGVVLAPGAKSSPCTFSGPFTGKAGDSQTDTVTVTGVNNGTTVTATAQATVSLTPVPSVSPPQIAVTKAAAPPSAVEPGGTFTFTVQVHNPSTTTPVLITQLVDNIYGNLATRPGSTCGALIGVTLVPGGTSAPCTFTGPFTGKAGDAQTDTVTVTGTNNGTTVTATAQAKVTLTPAGPQIALKKVASPTSLPAPGGNFTFTATVSNPSTLEPVTITKLVDNVYGDLATRPGSTCGTLIGVTLAPGATSAPCTFTGPFSGSSGASQTDVITVTGTSNGTTVTATAQATVTLTPGPSRPAAVSPVNLHAPGACVTTSFKIYVTGTNIRAVVYYLDGRRIGSVSRRDSLGRLSFTVNPGALAKGKVHHLTAITQPVPHSGQPVRTARRTFAVCAPTSLPRFTG